MKLSLLFEEVAEFLFSIFLFSQLAYAWWVFPLLLFTPDISLVALAAGRRMGSAVYNSVHHKGLALGLIILGTLLQLAPVSLAGMILLGHTCFDRALGLGLMDGSTFTHAHLKIIRPKTA